MFGVLVKTSRRALMRYVPARYLRHMPPQYVGPKLIPGPPPGMSMGTLNALCAEHLGSRVRQCRHQHLAGWKKHGTFRLYLSGNAGTERTFIFKDERYTVEDIPALLGFPALPGPPEYHIYTRPMNSAIAEFRPKLLWSAQVEPGRHFQYLLEDLGYRYRKPQNQKKDLLSAVRLIIEAHKAMRQSLSGNDRQFLIDYDTSFSEKMLEYARVNLERYSLVLRDQQLIEIGRWWSDVVKFHREGESYRTALNQPIHGDYNRANIFFGINKDDRAKITDWEWAGFGVPHADLASLLKRAGPEVEEEAIRMFAREHRQLSAGDQPRLFRWCLLERKLLDAGFLARVEMASESRRPAFQKVIRRSVADALAIARSMR